jgi:hypothetical protein
MKFLDTLLGSMVMCITSLPLIMLILILQRGATVPANPALDQAQIAEIQQLLIDNDPRQLLASDFQQVRLAETELNALAIYVKDSNPALESINVHTDLIENGAMASLSIPINAMGLHRYFNIALNFNHVDDRLSLTSVEAGSLNIPAPLLAPMREFIAIRLREEGNFQLVSSFIDSLHFQSISEDNIVIQLDWQDENLEELGDQARQVFVSAREADRMIYYHDRLVTITNELPREINTIGLNDLLRPLFLYASVNSAGGADPIAENRAVFIVLSAYLTELDLATLIGDDVELAIPRVVDVVIDRREDLARHVVTSAAISASAGAGMAEVLSVYKEVHDSRYRTGFSFTDIAANQAGSRLGDLASRSEADAFLFQDLMKAILNESEFMPSLGTYDGMTEEEFIARFGSRESEAYLQRVQEITDSIAARPFYQSF